MALTYTELDPHTMEPLAPTAPAPPAAPERWLTLSQAAAHIGVSTRTLYNWMGAGKVQVRRTVTGSVRVLEASLWLAEGAEGRKSPQGQAGRDAANAKHRAKG